MNPETLGFVSGVTIGVPILMWRMTRPRRLKLDRLWVMPTVTAGLLAIWLASMGDRLYLSPAALSALGLSTLLGAAFGWWRAGQDRITMDARTGSLMVKAPPIVLIALLLLIAAKLGLRMLTGGLHGLDSAQHDASLPYLLSFLAAMVISHRCGCWSRARRLLADRV
jgi:hypothetical protein